MDKDHTSDPTKRSLTAVEILGNTSEYLLERGTNTKICSLLASEQKTETVLEWR